MDIFWQYFKAFIVGGALCLIGQILIDKTKLTPARILTSYVVAGVILGTIGVYQPLVDWAGAGATVPLTGFGNLLIKGVKEAIQKDGPIHRRVYSRSRRYRRRCLLRRAHRRDIQARRQKLKKAAVYVTALNAESAGNVPCALFSSQMALDTKRQGPRLSPRRQRLNLWVP